MHPKIASSFEELRDESGIPSFNASGFKVFTFQPEERFFTLPFAERLKILEERITWAKQSLQETVHKKVTIENAADDKHKLRFSWFKKLSKRNKKDKLEQPQSVVPPSAIFVAPEYLFKDFSELSYKRYYSQEQKNAFKNKLKELSMQTNMLIVPGTICWAKEGKTDHERYYRNTAYFFHQGTVQKYKKRAPHTNYDFDYAEEGFLDLLDLRRLYFKSGERDALVKNFSGMQLGIEICYDSVLGELYNFLNHSVVPLNIQLILADGAQKPVLVEQEGTLFIKVEKNAKETQIGKIICNEENGRIEIECTKDTESIAEDLSCFKFPGISYLL
jgi:hypothetical protein